MKKKLLLILLAFAQLGVFSQQLRNKYGDVYYDANLYDNNYESIEGSPYLDPEFKPAKINELNETKFVRFNAFEGKIEVKEKNGVIVLSDSDSYVISLQDGSNKIYETRTFKDESGNSQVSFFELLKEQPHYKLYLKESITLTKEVKAQGYAKAEPAKFKRAVDTFYVSDFMDNSRELLIIPYRMKGLLAMFPQKQKVLKSFTKEHKLKTRNAEDLIKIFDYYFSD
ncbi:hypothetical protein [Muriicola sp.]|uniref:hypothetical protein n=1 Tax=Muriicola sp. TaxID=2020856 RepID=UPI003C75C2D1